MIRQSRSIPKSCQSRVLLAHSQSSFSIFFTPFIYFFLDQFQINLNYNFILSTTLSRQIDLCRHTRRLCLTFFLFYGYIFGGKQGDCACLYFMFPYQSWWAHEEIVRAFIGLLGWSLFYDILVRLFTVCTRDWRVCPCSTINVGRPVLLFSGTGQLLLYC